MKILIVEDLKLMRDLLVRMQSGLPFVTAVETVDDTPAVLPAIQAFQPDVVTLDLQLPSGSGLDVLRSLKQVQQPPTVIMLTNQADAHTKRACLDAGASFFLDKSTELQMLPAILEMLTRRD